LRDNSQSNLPLDNGYRNIQKVNINPVGAVVKKVIMYGDSTYLFGVEFYDKEGALILQAGKPGGKHTKEFEL
jgi:hypothetical protein